MKSFYLLLLITLIYSTASAQDGFPNYYKYANHINEANAFYSKGDFISAAKSYKLALDIPVEKGIDIPVMEINFTIASTWGKAGQVDSALKYLDKTIQLGFVDVDKLKNNADFTSINNHPKWNGLLNIAVQNKEKANKIRQNYIERTTFNNITNEVVFNPLTNSAKKFLENEEYPFISLNYGMFRLFFRGNSFAAKNIENVKSHLDIAQERIFKVLNVKSYQKGVNLIFVDDKEEMKNLTGFAVGGGLALPTDDLVFIVWNGSRRMQAKHEIFHTISNQFWGETKSRLLNEGAAFFADNECFYNNPIYTINASFLKHKKLFSIKSLVTDFDNKAKEAEVIAYLQSAAIFKYLYEEYGIEKMQKLWLSNFDQFESIYGFTIETLEKRLNEILIKTKTSKDINIEKLLDEGCG